MCRRNKPIISCVNDRANNFKRRRMVVQRSCCLTANPTRPSRTQTGVELDVASLHEDSSRVF